MRSHFHHQGWLGGLPVAQSWNVLVKPMVSLRACGARPSADGQAMGRRRCGGKAGDGAKAAFSEGRTLCVRVARPYSCHGISSRHMGGRAAVA
jgi:hypothetical protein